MPRVTDRPRGGFIGASESAAVVGLDPYTSRFDVWARKTGRQTYEEENRDMRRGKLLEPIVRNVELPLRSDVHATYDPEPDEFWLHENGVSGSHPDGEIEMVHPTLELPGRGALEIKTVNREMFSIIQEQGLPSHHVIQLNKTIGLTEKPWGAFGVHCADSWETLLFPLMLDTSLYQYTVDQEAKFKAQHIDTDVAPQLFPDDPVPEIPTLAGDTVDVSADEEWIELMDEYTEYYETKKVLEELWPSEDQLRRALKQAEDTEEERELSLKERIQAKMVRLEAEGALGAGWKFLYRPGATRKQFYRELVTELGPYDPDKVARILEEELCSETDELKALMSAAALEPIFGRLMLEARVTGEDSRFFREINQPYFRSWPKKEG